MLDKQVARGLCLILNVLMLCVEKEVAWYVCIEVAMASILNNHWWLWCRFTGTSSNAQASCELVGKLDCMVRLSPAGCLMVDQEDGSRR